MELKKPKLLMGIRKNLLILQIFDGKGRIIKTLSTKVQQGNKKSVILGAFKMLTDYYADHYYVVPDHPSVVDIIDGKIFNKEKIRKCLKLSSIHIDLPNILSGSMCVRSPLTF